MSNTIRFDSVSGSYLVAAACGSGKTGWVHWEDIDLSSYGVICCDVCRQVIKEKEAQK